MHVLGVAVSLCGEAPRALDGANLGASGMPLAVGTEMLAVRNAGRHFVKFVHFIEIKRAHPLRLAVRSV